MATNTLIQTHLVTPYEGDTRLVVDSNGRLFTCYAREAPVLLVMAYSDDAGVSWTEVTTSLPSSLNGTLSIAIDSTDTVHVFFRYSNYIVGYRTFSGLVWGSIVDIYDGTGTLDSIDSVSIAIDSLDVPHVVWSQNRPSGGSKNIYYNNKSGGVWGTRVNISDDSTNNYVNCKMVIDSTGEIWVFYTNSDGSSPFNFFYSRYVASWTTIVTMTVTGSSCEDVASVIDSSDNVYVITRSASNGRFFKHTKSSDSWTISDSAITTVVGVSNAFSLGIDTDDVLYFVFQSSSVVDIYLNTYDGSWSGESLLIDELGTSTYPMINTPIFPRLGAVSTQVFYSGYHFVYIDDSSFDSIFYYSNAVGLQVPQDEVYSSEANGSLPSDDANLSSLFNASGYAEVSQVDNIFATQSATDEYSIFEFKNKGNAISDNIVVTWIGQSNIAPSTSTVYLQIYNRDTTTWETLDSNSSSGANANFSLSGTKTSSLSSYYNGSFWVSCRVYQLAA